MDVVDAYLDVVEKYGIDSTEAQRFLNENRGDTELQWFLREIEKEYLSDCVLTGLFAAFITVIVTLFMVI